MPGSARSPAAPAAARSSTRRSSRGARARSASRTSGPACSARISIPSARFECTQPIRRASHRRTWPTSARSSAPERAGSAKPRRPHRAGDTQQPSGARLLGRAQGVRRPLQVLNPAGSRPESRSPCPPVACQSYNRQHGSTVRLRTNRSSQHCPRIDKPVSLVLFTQTIGGSESGPVAKQVLDELARSQRQDHGRREELHSRPRGSRKYGVDASRRSSCSANGKDTRMRFLGAPTGYEFVPLVEAVLLAGTGKIELEPRPMARSRLGRQADHCRSSHADLTALPQGGRPGAQDGVHATRTSPRLQSKPPSSWTCRGVPRDRRPQDDRQRDDGDPRRPARGPVRRRGAADLPDEIPEDMPPRHHEGAPGAIWITSRMTRARVSLPACVCVRSFLLLRVASRARRRRQHAQGKKVYISVDLEGI